MPDQTEGRNADFDAGARGAVSREAGSANEAASPGNTAAGEDPGKPAGPRLLLAIGTAPAADLARIARALVEKQVIACANIVKNAQSIYEWNGELVDESEDLLIMKLHPDNVSLLKELFVAAHPYDVPELLIVNVDDGNDTYLDWVRGVIPGS